MSFSLQRLSHLEYSSSLCQFQISGIGFVTLSSMLQTMLTKYWWGTKLTWMKANGYANNWDLSLYERYLGPSMHLFCADISRGNSGNDPLLSANILSSYCCARFSLGCTIMQCVLFEIYSSYFCLKPTNIHSVRSWNL